MMKCSLRMVGAAALVAPQMNGTLVSAIQLAENVPAELCNKHEVRAEHEEKKLWFNSEDCWEGVVDCGFESCLTASVMGGCAWYTQESGEECEYRKWCNSISWRSGKLGLTSGVGACITSCLERQEGLFYYLSVANTFMFHGVHVYELLNFQKEVKEEVEKAEAASAGEKNKQF